MHDEKETWKTPVLQILRRGALAGGAIEIEEAGLWTLESAEA
jgi:hypothetical protein